jgi:hypothetical protein
MDREERGRRGSPEKGTKTPAEQIMPTKGKISLSYGKSQD